MTKIPFSVKLKALFSKNSSEVYFAYFTDEERELQKMNIWDLAGEIQDATIRSDIRKKTVAEYFLSSRIARIQSKASWGATLLGFTGAIIGAAVAYAVGHTC